MRRHLLRGSLSLRSAFLKFVNSRKSAARKRKERAMYMANEMKGVSLRARAQSEFLAIRLDPPSRPRDGPAVHRNSPKNLPKWMEPTFKIV